MIIKEITEDNAHFYNSVIPPEYIYEVGREYIRGLVGEGTGPDDVLAAIMWELKNVEDLERVTEAEITWFYASDAMLGEELLKAFEDSTMKSGVKRSYFEFANLNSQEKTALQAYSFSLKNTESRSLYVTVKELSNVKLPRHRAGANIVPVSEISQRQYKAGIMNCVYQRRYGLLDDLPFLPKSRFDPNISCCCLMDGDVTGFLLVHQLGSGIHIPELFFATEPDASINLLSMLRFSIDAAVNTLDLHEMIQIKRVDDAIMQLSAKLFPAKKGNTVFCGEK